MRSAVQVGLVDYGNSANLLSVQTALEHSGAAVTVVKDSASLSRVSAIVLPGVGAFPHVYRSLEKSGLLEALRVECLRKPTLGICLGAQLLLEVGYEFEETPGLSLLPGEVRPLMVKGVVPHMGWARVRPTKASALYDGINEETPFYFMHSYEMVNFTDVSALSTYQNHAFVAAVEKGTVHGVQFHPEKSREAGLRLLKNFLSCVRAA